jgi:hypothetical protein
VFKFQAIFVALSMDQKINKYKVLIANFNFYYIMYCVLLIFQIKFFFNDRIKVCNVLIFDGQSINHVNYHFEIRQRTSTTLIISLIYFCLHIFFCIFFFSFLLFIHICETKRHFYRNKVTKKLLFYNS